MKKYIHMPLWRKRGSDGKDELQRQLQEEDCNEHDSSYVSEVA